MPATPPHTDDMNRPMNINEVCLLARTRLRKKQSDMPCSHTSYSEFERGRNLNIGLVRLAKILVILGFDTFAEAFADVDMPLPDFIRQALAKDDIEKPRNPKKK